MNISLLILFLGLCLSVNAYSFHTVYSGNDFTDESKFVFEDISDPNAGSATYVNKATAMANNLITVQTLGTNYYKTTIKSATDPNNNRKRLSLRLRTVDSQVHSRGLWVMEFSHIPEGCSTWPAFWLNSKWYQNKPNFLGGEIDVLEGVNDGNGRNSATLHTNKDYTCKMWNYQAGGFAGTWKKAMDGVTDARDCNVAAPNQWDNQGCGIEATSTSTFGTGLNAIGGGFYAVEVTDYFIKVFFFPRSTGFVWSSNPNPSTWTSTYGASTLIARFDFNDQCPSTMFYDFNTILNTNFCGGWAGGNTFYNPNDGTGMCNLSRKKPDNTFANPTGLNCEDWVAANQAYLNTHAYWEVNSITYYSP